MSDLHVVILAAGKGTRMKSARPKVLHELAGRSLIRHVLGTAGPLEAAETIVVVGYGATDVQDALAGESGLRFVVQTEQLGTGHALRQAAPLLEGRRGTVLLLYADVPLLRTETLQRLIEQHRRDRAAATVLTAELPDPFGYGRIIRDPARQITRIVEERDASPDERAIREVNSGIYALELGPLFESLSSLATDNTQGEYYLTDLVALYRSRGLGVGTLRIDDPAEIRGVNSRMDLAELTEVLRTRKRRTLMLEGVTLEDPARAYIDEDVAVGADTIIGPGVILNGRTTIGARCRIHAGVRVTDSVIGDDVTILDHSVIVQSAVGPRASIGPSAHLRPNSDLAEDTHVGNFVELKNTRMGAGSKAGHLAYLGDATIGEHVNIGAGTITCNYDGERKHRTVIEDHVFIGSDSQLIAPVTVGAGAYVAAGSSITHDVPGGSLAVARTRQLTKPGWVSQRRARRAEESR